MQSLRYIYVIFNDSLLEMDCGYCYKSFYEEERKMQCTVRECIVLLKKCVCTEVHSQSLLLCDVKRGCHVDEGRKAVQVVTVGMRKDGVCLNKREEGGRKSKD